MAPELLPLLAGAPAWRLTATLLLAACLLGALLALRLGRARAAASAPGAISASPPGVAASTAPDAAMDLWSHVEELRRRILWCVAAWLATTMAAFSLRLEERAWGWLPVPALHDNLAAQTYRLLADHLVPDGVRLVVLRPLDGFAAEFTIAMAIGFAVALPVLLVQVGSFLSPALRPRERRALRLALLPALALFAAGASFAFVVLAPTLLETLYGYPVALGAEPFLLVDELVSFTVTLVLVFGVASLTPMAMAALAATGLVGWRGFLRVWRHATVAILILCALVTDGTLVTLALVATPLIALYFLGVGVAAWAGRNRTPS